MQDELSRLMNGLFEGNGRPTQSWVPTLDAWETESELVYAFDLPGIGRDGISVEVEDGTLTVSAERARPESRTSTSTVSSGATARFPVRSPSRRAWSRRRSRPPTTTECSRCASRGPSRPKPQKIEVGVEAAAPATVEGASKPPRTRTPFPPATGRPSAAPSRFAVPREALADAVDDGGHLQRARR